MTRWIRIAVWRSSPSRALRDTCHFAATVGLASDSLPDRARYLSLFHALDHLDRLVAACSAPAASDARDLPTLRAARETLTRSLATALDWLTLATGPAPNETLGGLSAALAEKRREHRRALLKRTAFRQASAEAGVSELTAMQWIERVGYHTWRAVYHLGVAGEPTQMMANELTEEPEGCATAADEFRRVSVRAEEPVRPRCWVKLQRTSAGRSRAGASSRRPLGACARCCHIASIMVPARASHALACIADT
jgi:hypothetical protein